MNGEKEIRLLLERKRMGADFRKQSTYARLDGGEIVRVRDRNLA